MPRPVYIICSLGGAEDKATGLISLFHVLETVNIVRRPPDRGISPITIRTTAVWMRTEGDDESVEYEFQSIFRSPPHGTEAIIRAGQFSFGKPLFRFVADVTFMSFVCPGTLTVVHRIRKMEEGSTWLTQEYSIMLEDQTPAEAEVPGEG